MRSHSLSMFKKQTLERLKDDPSAHLNAELASKGRKRNQLASMASDTMLAMQNRLEENTLGDSNVD
jgi:hypothetical protein